MPQRLLIDTNILMLLIIGTWDRSRISAHRRTRIFTATDFEVLTEQLRRYQVIVTTQAVLTEASNLMGNDFHSTVAGTFVEVAQPFVEVVRPKKEIFSQVGFDRLGFADSSILASLDQELVVLTDDVALYNQVLFLGSQAINFNHLRRF